MSHDRLIGKTVVLKQNGQPGAAAEIKHRIDSVHKQADGTALYDAFIPSSRTEVKLTASELEDARVVEPD
jgi:hypothetical protein